MKRVTLQSWLGKASCILLAAIVLPAVLRAAEDPSLPALVGAELMQNALSAGLAKSSDEWKKRQAPRMERLVDDIQRTLRLPPQRLELLKIAAQGVLQQHVEEMAGQMAAEAERRTKGVSPKVAAKVLTGIGMSGMQGLRIPQDSFWNDVVRQIVTQEEWRKWEEVTASRQAYRSRALAGYVLSKIAPQLGLGKDQQKEMLGLIAQAAADYLPDLMNMFGGSEEDGEPQIYLPYVMVLTKGVPEDRAKALIRPDRWEKWRAAAGDGAQNWEWIQQGHEQRLKQDQTRK